MSEAKIVMSKAQLHKAVGLSADLTVTAIHVTNDPDLLYVRLSGERFEGLKPKFYFLNYDDSEVPIVRLSEVRDGM